MDMKKIDVIIPAGGPGGGMYPFTAGMPKSLIPIDDKPMLIHILENLDPNVFKRIIIVSDKFYPMIVEYVNAFKHKISIPIEFKQIFLPPTQTLLELRDELSDDFAIHYCDIITGKIAWKDAYQNYLDKKKTEPELAGNLFVSKYYYLPIGIVRQDSKQPEYISEFVEKPERIMLNYVNMAVSIFSKKILDDIKPSHMSLYGESIPNSITKGKKFIYEEHGKWYHFQRIGEWFDNQHDFYENRSK